jgi:hypothetical protein
MKHRLPLTLCFLFFILMASAQQFGGFPPRTRWQQIHTDTLRLIFTPASVQQAQRIAAIVHRMAATENPLGKNLKPINIVLHQNTTLANGYVALAPYRSEFYLVPGSNLFEFGNLPWSDQLAVHEYRHVQQYNNFNRGLSRAAGFLLGQEGRALANAVSVPDWFFEGDAVYAETIYTPGGRGRQPYFFNTFNALWKEGREFSWAKLRNGSFRDQVPGHYPLGYLLVNYGYQKYGPEFWGKVTRDASSFKGLFYPFQQAVERHSGISFKKFRTEALASYAHEVSKRRDDQGHREVVTNYYFPQQVSADTMIYLKEGFQTIPGFYRRTPAGEKRIALRGISSEEWLNYQKGTVAYTTYSTHPRWSLVDYSDIILLDAATGKKKKITRGEKYFTPALSPDDSTLIAVAVNDSLQSELRVLSRDGLVLLRKKTPAGALFVHPQYIDAQTIVVGLRHSGGRMSLNRLDLATMKFSQLLPTTHATIGFFYPYAGKVYFTSSLNGTDDLYELDPETKSVFRITTGGVGHYFPSVHDTVLTWSDFTSNGFRIRQSSVKSGARVEIPAGQWGLAQTPFVVAGADSAQQLVDVVAGNYPVTTYPKSTGLFNIHSWRPYYEDPEFTFSVFSDNVLNTFSNEFYYRYNQNENGHAVGWSTAYSALYPVLTAGVEHSFSRTVRTTSQSYELSGTDIRVGYYIPLNFTAGNTYKYLRFGSDLVFNHTSPLGSTKSVLSAFSSSYLSHTISWTQQLPRTQQQIFPRLGYSVLGNYRHRVDEKGYQALASANLFLPGFFRTHSLVLQGNVQQVDTSNVLFANRFANSRGYADYYYSRMWRVSGNYHLPLLYPEVGIGNIVYWSRLRGNAFYDLTRIYSRNKTNTTDLRTVGAEFTLDTRWWNSYPISVTVRYSYLLDANIVGATSPHIWEIVLPVSIIPR